MPCLNVELRYVSSDPCQIFAFKKVAMSNPLEEPLDEFFNRVTALNDVSLRDQVPGGIPGTHHNPSSSSPKRVYVLRIHRNGVDSLRSSTYYVAALHNNH